MINTVKLDLNIADRDCVVKYFERIDKKLEALQITKLDDIFKPGERISMINAVYAAWRKEANEEQLMAFKQEVQLLATPAVRQVYAHEGRPGGKELCDQIRSIIPENHKTGEGYVDVSTDHINFEKQKWVWVPMSFEAWRFKMQVEFEYLYQKWKDLGSLQERLLRYPETSRSEPKRERDRRREVEKSPTRKIQKIGQPAQKSEKPQFCFACGRSGHKRAECKLKDHPNVNHGPEPWMESKFGKLWWAKKKIKELPWKFWIDEV